MNTIKLNDLVESKETPFYMKVRDITPDGKIATCYYGTKSNIFAGKFSVNSLKKVKK